jgi:hypothetical protein
MAWIRVQDWPVSCDTEERAHSEHEFLCKLADYTFIWQLMYWQAWTGHEGSWSLRLPDSKTIWHMEIRLSDPRTGRIYSAEDNPGANFCYSLSRHHSYGAARRIISTKTPNLPAYSAVSQPTMLTRDVTLSQWVINFWKYSVLLESACII